MLKGETGKTPIFNSLPDTFIDSKEFRINQGENVFYILVGKTMNSVTVKCLRYSANLNYNEISILTQNKFNNNDELFFFIVNIFMQNQSNIEIGIENNEMNLNLTFFNMNTNQNQKFVITMTCADNNTDYFINHLWNKLILLEQENAQLKINYQTLFNNHEQLFKEIQSLKTNLNYNNNMINSNNGFNNNINNFNNNPNNGFINANPINPIQQSINLQMNQMNIGNGISIFLKEQGGGNHVTTIHNCNYNDTIAQLMDKYREKKNNKNLKFYLTFNAQVLKPEKTLKQVGLGNLNTLNVIKGDPPIFH